MCHKQKTYNPFENLIGGLRENHIGQTSLKQTSYLMIFTLDISVFDRGSDPLKLSSCNLNCSGYASHFGYVFPHFYTFFS